MVSEDNALWECLKERSYITELFKKTHQLSAYLNDDLHNCEKINNTPWDALRDHRADKVFSWLV